MPRIRSIHPDALKSEKLASVSAEAERLYWRLSTHCDDDGRAEDDPEILASFLFPRSRSIDDAAINEWLQELADVGLLVRYTVDGDQFLAVTRWSDYQKPNKKTDSKLPAPPGMSSGPASDSGSPDVVLPLGEGDGGGVGERPDQVRDDFNSWYETYPRKEHRAKALECYRARRKEGISAEDLNAARDNYAKAKRGTESKYLLMPKTFLAREGPWSEYRDGPPILEAVPDAPRPQLGRGLDAESIWLTDDNGDLVYDADGELVRRTA